MQAVLDHQTDWLIEDEEMAVTEREFAALNEKIDRNHGAIIEMLDMRKEYFDHKFEELCRAVREMKSHCVHTQDQCAIVFKDHNTRIQRNSDDLIRVKTVWGTVWATVVLVAGYFLRKL